MLAGTATFIQLAGSQQELARRLEARTNHFMPTSLLDSQFAAFEPLAADEVGLQLDAARACDAMCDSVLDWLAVQG